MEIFVVTIVLTGAVFGIRQLAAPTCPRCGSKKWDRKLCRPLLLCRRCATRIDQQGRVFN